ncbi:hypothetical protein HZA96_07175 [Candidatus Woesearchaeota archaeon]|nr:hypothetical protein [Candidatus Woesearchaeota archaeon]
METAKVQYGELLKKSYADLKQNPILFLPLLYGLVFMIIIVSIVIAEYFIYLSSGFSFEANMLQIIFLGIIFFIADIIVFLFGLAIITTMCLGLLKGVVNNKTVSNSDLWQSVKKYLWIYLKIIILRMLIILVPFLVLGIIALLFFLISKTAGLIIGGILLILFILFVLAAVIFMVFAFLFVAPIITTDKSQSAIEIMKQSYDYLKQDTGHVVITWAIMFGISLVVQVPIQIISAVSDFFPNLDIILMPILFILFLLSIIIGIYLQLFLFNAYYNKNLKVKNLKNKKEE